ncbi:lymphocyte function-associated antigen 3-like [Nerophis lumbriciformis]|uniref:lymphocyte function-associated antigen 3-like n=1 Tax=Nerophis lumbriciformis TaxID=546530 RepID=UPI003BACA9C4
MSSNLCNKTKMFPASVFWRTSFVTLIRAVSVLEDYVPSSYKNRITLDRVSAELTIKNATYEDSGVCHLEMNINSEQDTFLCTIEVIDKVSKPNISCEMSDTKQATLVCSTESKHPHLLKFKWSSAGKEQTGPNLTIIVRNEDDDQVYRCDVSNPLTNETASFTAKDCFLGKRSDDHLIFLLVCIFIVVIIVCCVLYITREYLKVCKERDENTSLDQVLTLPSNQNKKNEKWNSGLNVLTEDEEMDSEGAMQLTVPVHALHSSSTDINTITELSETSNDQQDHLKNSQENVETEDFLSGRHSVIWEDLEDEATVGQKSEMCISKRRKISGRTTVSFLYQRNY